IARMIEAVEELSPQMPIDTGGLEAERLSYIADADSVGSIPPPSEARGAAGRRAAAAKNTRPALLMNKIGERIAFERTGTRLYDALIAKYLALGREGDVLPPASELLV